MHLRSFDMRQMYYQCKTYWSIFFILTKSSLVPFFSPLCQVFHFKVFPLPSFFPYILPFYPLIGINLSSLRLGEVTVSSQQRLSGSLSSSCLTGLSTGWMAYIHSAQLLHNLTVLILFYGLNVWIETRPMWHPDWPPPGYSEHCYQTLSGLSLSDGAAARRGTVS